MRRYSPVIVDHFTHPRNLGRLDDPDVTAEAANPCCGDRLRLEARVLDGRIVECAFLAHGCAATIAVGSLLAEAITGEDIDQLARHDEDWVADLAGGLPPNQRHCAVLGRELLQTLVRDCRALMRGQVTSCAMPENSPQGLFSTPKGLDIRARGRAAHPGTENGPKNALPRRGCITRAPPVMQPLRGR